MLPAAHRLRRSTEIAHVTKAGLRARRGCVVVHALLPAVEAACEEAACEEATRVGLIVGRGVGNSVVRHRVSRRLREAVRPQLANLPGGSELVIRALPAAGIATSAELRRDLSVALMAVQAKAQAR